MRDRPRPVGSTLALDVLRTEGVRGLAELSVLFVADAEIAELNEQYMGKAGPTDVLAFPIDADDVTQIVNSDCVHRGPDRAPVDPGDLPLLLGDVVICPSGRGRARRPSTPARSTTSWRCSSSTASSTCSATTTPSATRRRSMRARELALLEAHHWRGPAPDGFRQEQE